MKEALRWLAESQKEDGSWREGEDDLTGLALLAFTGAGYSHLRRDFGLVIRRGLDWLMSRQRDDGRIGSGDVSGAFALVEDYLLTGSRLLADPVRRAVDDAARQEDPGEWGVQIRRAAVLAGIEAVWTKAADTERSWSLEAASRLFFDKDPLNPRTAQAIEKIGVDLPSREKPDYSRWHHTSVALFAFDGPKGSRWIRWEFALKKALLPLQGADGSWSGSVRDTATNAMTLESYYRFAWVFGRK